MPDGQDQRGRPWRARVDEQYSLGAEGRPRAGCRKLSHGSWIPIAAMVAMKPSLEQAALVSAQRLVGTLIGAVVAGLLLLVPTSEHGISLIAVERGLEVVALVLLMHGAGIRFWNYTFYSAAIAAGALILVDLPQPSDYAAEGYRLLWTLCGVGCSLIVLLLAGLLAKRTANARPQPT
ncbi:FUSC family protein [Streptomyces sp. NPDC051997]|uniref:FUSC family protein n=1 Tax=Streptomyces sp. NPDC051997 TaxID=3155611 RepID=UPI0034399C7C